MNQPLEIGSCSTGVIPRFDVCTVVYEDRGYLRVLNKACCAMEGRKTASSHNLNVRSSVYEQCDHGRFPIVCRCQMQRRHAEEVPRLDIRAAVESGTNVCRASNSPEIPRARPLAYDCRGGGHRSWRGCAGWRK